MSSPWTSEYAIMRDLSLAQGYDVPAVLEATVAVDGKPPAPNIPEETEEEYFGHWVGDGDAPVAPDLGLIQQMLEMVRDTGISSDSEDESDKYLQISKPPLPITNQIEQKVEPKILNNNNNTIQSCLTKKPKKKRENVAVNSILEAIAGDIPIINMEKPNEPLKLLKPTDFMSTEKEIVESVEKVNGWLNSQQKDLAKPANRLLNWEPSTMFKRRSGSTVKSTGSGSVRSSPPKVASSPSLYQPGTIADEYYQKYAERSKMKQLVHEDVWSRAERIMKEIDAKKKSEAEALRAAEILETNEITRSPETSEDLEIMKIALPDAIRLPQHRHRLTGPCAVCASLGRRA